MTKKYNIAVLVSGGGSNLQAVIDNIKSGKLKDCQVKCIISSREDAFAIERGKRESIETLVIKEQKDISKALVEKEIDIIVLAGYMKILPKDIVEIYRDKIINIHPSLIPKYCGKGFYGTHVHQGVIDGDETESGATCHLVDEGVDTGRILIQEKVPVYKNDTAETLSARVLKIEHKILSKGIAMIIDELNFIKRQ